MTESDSLLLAATEKNETYSSVQSTCTLAPAPAPVGCPYGSHRIKPQMQRAFQHERRMVGQHHAAAISSISQMVMQSKVSIRTVRDRQTDRGFLASALLRANRPLKARRQHPTSLSNQLHDLQGPHDLITTIP